MLDDLEEVFHDNRVLPSQVRVRVTEQCARVKKLTYLKNTMTYKHCILNILTKPSLLAQ